LIRASMAGEGARFCRHYGFDWGAIATAWNRCQSGHGRLLGASTISMQTAKNVFLWPGRDWLRKGFEVWFTALIELAWGKRVLEPRQRKSRRATSDTTPPLGAFRGTDGQIRPVRPAILPTSLPSAPASGPGRSGSFRA
jgi:hypothetical protein